MEKIEIMDGSAHDPLPHIVDIISDCINAGLLSANKEDFQRKISTLKGAELEDYLQNLWDEI